MRSPGGVVGVEHVWFGTRFEVLATLLPGQRIRLKTVFELRPRVISDVAGDDGGEQTGISVQRISNSMEFLVGQTMTLARTIKSHGEDQDEQAAVGEPNSTAHKLSNPRAETELIVFLTPELMHSPIAPRALHGVPDDATDDESSKMIEPAVFEPVDWDAFGPPMPVMKRRTPRE